MPGALPAGCISFFTSEKAECAPPVSKGLHRVGPYTTLDKRLINEYISSFLAAPPSPPSRLPLQSGAQQR